jgi:glutamyl-tRNA reductase
MRSRRNRPIFFIDIAVPRDVDPEINRISNAYVYNIDDLKGVVDDNITDRTREAAKGERIVDEAVIRFRQWQESLDVVPTIVALRSKMEAIAATEREKTLQSLSNPSKHDRQAIQKMTDTLINKIMHDPTLYLKRNGHHGNKSACLDITRKLFKLND